MQLKILLQNGQNISFHVPSDHLNKSVLVDFDFISVIILYMFIVFLKEVKHFLNSRYTRDKSNEKSRTLTKIYEGDPRSNANSCVISFIIAIFQDSLHQNNDALSFFSRSVTIVTKSHSNPRCLATRKCKVNDLGHG